MTVGIFFRTAAVLLLVLVLQLELFSELRLWGVMPELLLGVSIAGAWVAGPDRGAVIGFTAGLLYDLYLPTPLAMTSLAYVLVAYAVGLIAVGAQSGEAPLRRMVTLAAVPIGITLFIVLGELLGEDLYGSGFAKLVILATLYTFALMGPVHWLMRWAFAIGRHDARAPVRLEMVE
jgi:rod shape-determining protein MreD